MKRTAKAAGGPACSIHERTFVSVPAATDTHLSTVGALNSRAALVESDARLRPGANTEMQIAMHGRRTSIKGRLDRCHVVALEPLRYRGVLVFEQRLEFEQ